MKYLQVLLFISSKKKYLGKSQPYLPYLLSYLMLFLTGNNVILDS